LKPIIIKEENGRLEILQTGLGQKREIQFFLAIQDGISKGYKIPEEVSLGVDMSFRNYKSTAMGKCVMFKEGAAPKAKVEEPKPEVAVKPDVVTPEPIVEPAEEKVVETPAKKAGRPSKKK
jgi:hypothetical protein